MQRGIVPTAGPGRAQMPYPAAGPAPPSRASHHRCPPGALVSEAGARSTAADSNGNGTGCPLALPVLAEGACGLRQAQSGRASLQKLLSSVHYLSNFHSDAQDLRCRDDCRSEPFHLTSAAAARCRLVSQGEFAAAARTCFSSSARERAPHHTHATWTGVHIGIPPSGSSPTACLCRSGVGLRARMSSPIGRHLERQWPERSVALRHRPKQH